MHIEFLVEEDSAEEALRSLIPNILGESCTFHVHTFQGKRNLLSELPRRLKGYKGWLPRDHRIVVLVDGHDEDCRRLKTRLEKAARNAGLRTKTSSSSTQYQVLNRIVVQELESWFLGDVEALRKAYPGISSNLSKRERFRNPDAVPGGAARALFQVLQRAHHPYSRIRHLPKRQVAGLVSRHMNPDENQSKSFQVFRDGLMEMLR